MSDAHTPAPWSVYKSAACLQIDIGAKPSGERPCVVSWTGFDSNDLSLKTNIANARLIAAAPELLAALQFLLAWNDDGGFSGERRGKVIAAARAAIAKAKQS